jgi:hypothetical protein
MYVVTLPSPTKKRRRTGGLRGFQGCVCDGYTTAEDGLGDPVDKEGLRSRFVVERYDTLFPC